MWQEPDLWFASRPIDDCPKCFGFNGLLLVGRSIVMTAEEYRARAEALMNASYVTTDLDLIREMEALAAEWHKLADLADQQEAMRAALKATRE